MAWSAAFVCGPPCGPFFECFSGTVVPSTCSKSLAFIGVGTTTAYLSLACRAEGSGGSRPPCRWFRLRIRSYLADAGEKSIPGMYLFLQKRHKIYLVPGIKYLVDNKETRHNTKKNGPTFLNGSKAPLKLPLFFCFCLSSSVTPLYHAKTLEMYDTRVFPSSRPRGCEWRNPVQKGWISRVGACSYRPLPATSPILVFVSPRNASLTQKPWLYCTRVFLFLQAKRRWVAEAALSKGVDFSCGAVFLSSPTPYVLDEPEVARAGKNVAGVGGNAGEVLPPWRRWTVNVMEKTGITARMQQAIRRAD